MSQYCKSRFKLVLSRAAIWSLRNQHYKLAAEYARLSLNHRIENIVIDKTSDILVRDLGELPTVINWIHDLKNEQYFQWNKLIYWLAWSLAFSYQWEKSKQLIDELSLALERDESLDAHTKLVYGTKVDSIDIILLTFKDEWKRCIEQSDHWLLRKDYADHFDKAVVYSAKFLCHSINRDYDQAKESILKAKEAIKLTNSIYGHVWVFLLYGYYLIDTGQFNQAKKVLDKLFFKTVDEIGEHSTILSTISLLLAPIYYEQDQIDEARNYLEIGFRSIQNHGLIVSAELGIITQVKINLLTQPDFAFDFFYDVEEIISIYPARLNEFLNYHQVELLILSNKNEEALTLFEELKPIDLKVSSRSTELFQTYIQLMLMMAKNNFKEANDVLELILQIPKIEKQEFFYCKLLMIRSYLNLNLHKDSSSALNDMRKVVVLSINHGYFRSIIDFKKYSTCPLKLLKTNLAKEDHEIQQYLNKINEALLLDPEPEIKLNFSKREIELLKLLETDLTYKEIGEKLHISFSTVKWHINNIYGKLEVKNRTGAVVAARDNALI